MVEGKKETSDQKMPQSLPIIYQQQQQQQQKPHVASSTLQNLQPATSSSVTSPIFNSIPVTNTSTPSSLSDNNQIQSSEALSPCPRQTQQQQQHHHHSQNQYTTSTKQDFTVQVNKNEIRNEIVATSAKQQQEAAKVALNKSCLMNNNQGLKSLFLKNLNF